MTTKLDGELRRELLIGKVAYTLILTPDGFTLALKGRRKEINDRLGGARELRCCARHGAQCIVDREHSTTGTTVTSGQDENASQGKAKGEEIRAPTQDPASVEFAQSWIVSVER